MQWQCGLEGTNYSTYLYPYCNPADFLSCCLSQSVHFWVKQSYCMKTISNDSDLKLLSPSLLVLQRMLNICKAFSAHTGLTFNAKKTLCIKFYHGRHVNEITQYTIFLGNDKLKWYSQVKHLGHIFNCCVNVSADVAYRKGQFIGCVNSIITQFGFAHLVCKLQLLVTHGYSFYGSSLWNIYDNDSKKLYITLYDLPRTAHTRLLTHIAGTPHVNLN